MSSHQSTDKNVTSLVIFCNYFLSAGIAGIQDQQQDCHCWIARVEYQGHTRYTRILDSKPFIYTCYYIGRRLELKLPIKMIKIIIYIDIAFFYRKANIIHRWSNILRKFYGNKGVCHCVIRMEACIASRGPAVAILKSLLCLSAGFSWLVSTWTHSCSGFQVFTDRKLAPAGLHSDLVTADADWRRLNLLADSRSCRCTSQETHTQIWNWLRQRPHSTQVVHCLQTVHCWLYLMCQR